MTAKLDNLVKINSLKKEPPNHEEYKGLIQAAIVALEDAKNESLSLDSRFTLAYGASFKFCLAALRRQGYRPNNKRYIVFQTPPDTLALGQEVWRVLMIAMRNGIWASTKGFWKSMSKHSRT